MRISHFIVLGLITFMLGFPTAKADDGEPLGRNFGATSCAQTFACENSEATDLSAIAGSCASFGLGASIDFSDAELDDNNCMMVSTGNNGVKSSSVVCCVVPSPKSQGMCGMTCSRMIK